MMLPDTPEVPDKCKVCQHCIEYRGVTWDVDALESRYHCIQPRTGGLMRHDCQWVSPRQLDRTKT